jgi:hypothetical protein
MTTRRYESCVLCGEEILSHRKADVARQVWGWLIPTRTGGGQIIGRTETGALAHKSCAQVRKGKPVGQQLPGLDQMQL